jgi:3-oxoacyl-[acyl-carrier-protein] synthase-3
VGSVALGAEAARRALDDAGVRAEEIELIICATLSPDHDFPGNGALLQRALGVHAPATLDLRQQCNGFLAGLHIADGFIRTGTYRRVLVVAAEVQSTGLELSPRGRDMTVIFADGAGAAVLGPGEGEAGILGVELHVDGSHAEDLWCEFPSSRSAPRLTQAAIEEGRHYPRMNGKVVFKQAVLRMPEAVREILAATGHRLDELDLLVPHQANLRIIHAVREALQLSEDKVVVNIDRYGNTTAASIPLALDEARQAGRVPSGALVGLVAFGAGFTWGAALVRF